MKSKHKNPRPIKSNGKAAVAIYARVSTRERQEAQNQLRVLREYCRSADLTICAEYCDQASGKSADRPAFRRLMADAAQRRFDIVLFWALDRFSREGAARTLAHLAELTGYGIKFKSYTEQYLDSAGPFADAIIALLAALAKQERIRNSERVVAGLDRARAAGKTLGRPRAADPISGHELYRRYRSTKASYKELGAAVGMSTATVMRRLRPYLDAAQNRQSRRRASTEASRRRPAATAAQRRKPAASTKRGNPG
ncbi:recombinase family protein [bacterium]|nr:MAG: recombinase family protein [bacterium]